MANTHTHTHTHSAPRCTQGGWILGQGSNAILTHVGVAYPLIRLGAMNIIRTQWGRGEAVANTHTRTHTVPLVVHRVGGSSAKDRTQS